MKPMAVDGITLTIDALLPRHKLTSPSFEYDCMINLKASRAV